MKSVFLLETRKIKRTGYLPAFLGGGILAGAVPAVNMAVRSEIYTAQSGSPFRILMNANWQMMAQLNIFLLVCGACILYHTEYSGNCLQKAEALPINPFRLFLGKLWILVLSCLIPMCLETASLVLCCMRWFPERMDGRELLTGMAFECALLLPAAILMLLIASMCQNMWICLGTGVILVFLSSILPSASNAMAMVPFSAPYRMLHQLESEQAAWLLAGCALEIFLFSVGEYAFIRIRRCFV